METKKSIASVAASVAPVVEATTSGYIARARLSGNPLLKANAEGKIYANDRENGTTAVLLAILGSVEGVTKKSRIVTGTEFRDAFTTLRSNGYKADSWTRTEKAYAKIGGNSSAIEKKIGPVVTGLIREIKNGNLAGFDPSAIGTENVRKIIGYNY